MATTFVRVYAIAVIDHIQIARAIFLDIFIDDYGVSAVGTEASVSTNLKEGATVLMKAIQQDMHCSVADDKASVIASTPSFGTKLVQFLGKYAGGPAKPSAVNLGVDDTVGKPRRKGHRGSKWIFRLKNFQARTKRLQKSKAAHGKWSRKIFITGPLAGVTFGAEVHGTSDHELKMLRRAFGKCVKPAAGSRSLTSLCILEHDPCY